jgi:hypothetical protein
MRDSRAAPSADGKLALHVWSAEAAPANPGEMGC